MALRSERDGQLLHAAERLQDAIRRRRQSSGLSSVTAVSFSASSDDEKENDARNCDFDTQPSQAFESDDDATDCADTRARGDWERRSILRMSELSLSAWSDVATPDAAIGELTRRALDWMQRDTEQQARETRALRQELLHAVGTLNDVFMRLQREAYSGQTSVHIGQTSGGTGRRAGVDDDAFDWRSLSIESVVRLADEWEAVVRQWRARAADVERAAQERVALSREESDAKLQLMHETHATERGMRALRSEVLGLLWVLHNASWLYGGGGGDDSTDELTQRLVRLATASDAHQSAWIAQRRRY